jgi:hypothetical protein
VEDNYYPFVQVPDYSPSFQFDLDDIASLSDFIVNAALTALANPEVILGAVFSSVLSWGIFQ